ncbi:TPA: YihA family ribosome biogenesis GTP-binding protein, partial [Staphylococcus aureus]|nr:YihA family ribosome biogenesis GTP-binding protein [Staphylococcus aureus]HCW8581019.1 YihA family ribosome biogenesis GTP-binding protein [Staphylococcus aureus]HCZ6990799.1 YihA family ribosome biogenesis GTP-binding protein [Staphylococcus aureus]HEP1244585.1 YihA family ribosome biogenesis GTP-binding protein [Staphylococcus aureus]
SSIQNNKQQQIWNLIEPYIS